MYDLMSEEFKPLTAGCLLVKNFILSFRSRQTSYNITIPDFHTEQVNLQPAPKSKVATFGFAG